MGRRSLKGQGVETRVCRCALRLTALVEKTRVKSKSLRRTLGWHTKTKRSSGLPAAVPAASRRVASDGRTGTGRGRRDGRRREYEKYSGNR